MWLEVLTDDWIQVEYVLSKLYLVFDEFFFWKRRKWPIYVYNIYSYWTQKQVLLEFCQENSDENISMIEQEWSTLWLL